MAKRKYVTEVAVKEDELSVGDIIKKGAEAPAWKQVVASVLLDEQIAQLTSLCGEIKERIKSTPLTEIKTSLVAEGKLYSVDEDAAIVITTRYGDELKVSMTSAKDSGFTVDKGLKDFIDSLPASMTRTPPKTLESTKVLEALFDKGEIPDLYKGYFSKHPTEITKTTTRRKEK